MLANEDFENWYLWYDYALKVIHLIPYNPYCSGNVYEMYFWDKT